MDKEGMLANIHLFRITDLAQQVGAHQYMLSPTFSAGSKLRAWSTEERWNSFSCLALSVSCMSVPCKYSNVCHQVELEGRAISKPVRVLTRI